MVQDCAGVGDSVWEPDANSCNTIFPGGGHEHHANGSAADDDERQHLLGADVGAPSIIDEAKQAQTPLFVELCAGCGILSATVAAEGFDVMAVDHSHNKHKTHVKMFNLDLSKEHSWGILRHIITECNVMGVHMAPPCGTCSRAREIRLNDDWHRPQPLRDYEHPYGVPWMSAKDAERVRTANGLYKHMAQFCEFLDDANVPWTMENPTNSWLWELPCRRLLVQKFFFADFHSCAYGGKRYKATSFLTNHAAFLVFCQRCDNSHVHLPWGYDQEAQQFSTALEAEYPKELCVVYARVLSDMAKDKLIQITPFKPKMHPQKQRSGRSVPPLIPEYVKVTTILLEHAPTLDNKQRLMKPLANIPTGSKLLRTEAERGSQGDNRVLYVFGIFHGHQQFVTVAKTLWHPYDELRHIPDLMIKAIFELLSNSKLSTARSRLKTLQLWRSWATELTETEVGIKCTMPPRARKIMTNKRLALLQKISEDCLDWPDKAIHKDLRCGFRLVGEEPATGIFRTQPKTATLSEDELMMQSRFLKPAIVGKARSAGVSLHTEALYDVTVKEATDKGWLEGPYSLERMNEMLGDRWLPVRRFGVEQRGKLRPIDDFCENQLNSAFTTVDKISLRTLDHMLWAALMVCRHCLYNRDMDFVMKDGTRLKGPVHTDWHGDSGMKVTALDLRSAYKQLPLNEADMNKAVVTILNPTTGHPEFFLMNTLPFGAAASVLHFNRVSNLLWAIGCKLGIVWSSYYDDFPLLCHHGLEQSTLGAAKAMFNILGFDYAEDKLRDPDDKAEILGIELDVTDSCRGTVRVGNRKDRISDIGKALDTMIQEKRLRPKDLPSHLGRLQYAEMQITGRAGRMAMADLRKLGTADNSYHDLDSTAINALVLLKARLTAGKPKTLTVKPVTKPWLLFTDGALEYNGKGEGEATIGAVRIPPDGGVQYFGCGVPQGTMDLWKVDGKEHVIGLVELYANRCCAENLAGAPEGSEALTFH